MSEILLEASHLRKGYKNHPVLKDVSFALEAGTSTALVGLAGAGKSTLIRTLAGLEVPDEGSVSLFGSSNEKELCRARRQTGFVLESPFGYETQTVLRNILLRAEPTASRTRRGSRSCGRSCGSRSGTTLAERRS